MGADAFLRPDWPAPAQVRALTTTRLGGVSEGPYASLNLAAHVQDADDHVTRNRARLRHAAALPAEPVWLEQVHGVEAVAAAEAGSRACADASFSDRAGVVCAVLTADCLPILLCTEGGERVAAIHAGWRGLAAGIVESTLARWGGNPSETLAWLGPAIGPQAFEVGDEVRQAFTDWSPQCADAFTAVRPGHWLADLYRLARLRLAAYGVPRAWGGHWCTYSEPQRFYSYRRQPVTGRMASLIWIANDSN